VDGLTTTLTQFLAFAATGHSQDLRVFADATAGVGSLPHPEHVRHSQDRPAGAPSRRRGRRRLRRSRSQAQALPGGTVSWFTGDAQNHGDGYTEGRAFLDTNAPGGPGQKIEVDVGFVTSSGNNLDDRFDFNFTKGCVTATGHSS
jgi:hypothetical protein